MRWERNRSMKIAGYDVQLFSYTRDKFYSDQLRYYRVIVVYVNYGFRFRQILKRSDFYHFFFTTKVLYTTNMFLRTLL